MPPNEPNGPSDEELHELFYSLASHEESVRALYLRGKADAEAENGRLKTERDEAQAKVVWFVENAANERLDGYRELGQRAADAENRLDIERAANAALRQCVRDREAEALAAMAEADELRAELEDAKPRLVVAASLVREQITTASENLRLRALLGYVVGECGTLTGCQNNKCTTCSDLLCRLLAKLKAEAT